jgi:tetratricopeptide (TPR) repeat protein
MILACSLALADDSLSSANAALAANDLAGAEAGYRAILAGGSTGGDVWYNLGNILYRLDRPAEAVLAWRNAQARLPRDPDVEANLDFVRRTLKDGLRAPDPHPWFAPWQAALTPDEGEWLGAALAGAGLLAVALRRRATHAPLAAVGIGGIAIGALLAGGGWAESRSSPVAVVLVDTVTATSDLGGGVELFSLHLGAEVQSASREAGRALVVLPDGRKGWVPETAVGFVDPSAPPPVL